MWVKLDDRYAEHPKILALSDAAFRLHLSALCYCGRHLTDGFVPARVPRLMVDDADEAIASLVAGGLWHEAEGGWSVHDYLDYQPSREAVAAERRKSADRQARWRERNSESNGVTNGVSNTRPVPVPEPVVKTPLRRGRAAPGGFADLAKQRKKPDPLWDALVAALCLEPGDITAARRGRLNAALKELREVGASPDEIARRAKEYQRVHPEWAFTETALAAHWASLGRKRSAKPPVERLAEPEEPAADEGDARAGVAALKAIAGGTP